MNKPHFIQNWVINLILKAAIPYTFKKTKLHMMNHFLSKFRAT